MPPQVYEAALAAADIHVQVEVTMRQLIPPPGPAAAGHGTCRLGGRIVTVFRGPVQPGTTVSVDLPCRHQGADRLPIGGTVFSLVQELDGARFVELVLACRADGALEVAGEGLGIKRIEQPSGVPAFAETAVDADGEQPDCTGIEL